MEDINPTASPVVAVIPASPFEGLFEEITDIGVKINAEHRLARSSAETAVQHAIRCGELLLAQKARLKHGDFGAWIAENCEFAQASANNYMKAAKTPNTLGNSIRHLFPSGRPAASANRAKPNVTDEAVTALRRAIQSRRGIACAAELAEIIRRAGCGNFVAEATAILESQKAKRIASQQRAAKVPAPVLQADGQAVQP